ncbi:phage antirepressor KilAC domain-containing protein [Flavobacterium sp.]|uniref:phage antirepressor KilAC domain-containing protein n=1 Tax=Flavobacterium sp. TaxID=239 RepID=UPI00261AAC75|nr:phage antirepressor KilAC domain-containing protein [Flavobacterium sp.]
MTIFLNPFDEFAALKKNYSMTEAAEELNIPNFGRNKLYEFLRDKEIFNDRNAAHDEYVELGFFNSTITDKSYPNCVTTVTQKGILFLRELLK